VAGSVVVMIAAGGLFYYASQLAAGKRQTNHNEIAVTIHGHACEPNALTVPAGHASFRIINRSDRAVEWEILDGVLVVEERENIAPGLSQVINANLLPGDYAITCGLLSNPRGTLHVTPTAESDAQAKAKPSMVAFIGPLSEFRVYLSSQGGALVKAVTVLQQAIAAGDLAQGLALSIPARRGVYMLAAIVNAMLDRIEKLMNEVKGVCDNIAHDLRTPLTRLRAQLYRIKQQAEEDSAHAVKLDDAIAETDTLMARFRGLLRISELEDHQRRSGFLVLDPLPLLRELHDFYLPLAEEGELELVLQAPDSLPWITGDRALLFEALANLLSNSIKFTPPKGKVILRAVNDLGSTRIEVLDSGPGIPAAERASVFQRFYRVDESDQQGGFGLGLSIVAAIINLHGFKLEVGTSELGGARLVLECRQQLIPA